MSRLRSVCMLLTPFRLAYFHPLAPVLLVLGLALVTICVVDLLVSEQNFGSGLGLNPHRPRPHDGLRVGSGALPLTPEHRDDTNCRGFPSGSGRFCS